MAGSATITGKQNYVMGIGHPASEPLTEGSPAVFSTDNRTLLYPNGTAFVLSPDSINPAVTVYNADGTTSKRCMPKNDRLISKGSQWFSPTALSGTAARTCVLDTTGAFVAGDVSTAPGVIINCLTAGFVGSLGWTVNLPMPSDGLLQALVWVDDFENGQPWSTGSLVITLTGASGNIAYTYAATVFKPGWNTLQLWNPATAADAVCSKTGVSTAVNSGYNFTGNITSVGMTVNNMQLNANMRFAGIWTQTKVKPMVAMTFDTSAQNIFDVGISGSGAINLLANSTYHFEMELSMSGLSTTSGTISLSFDAGTATITLFKGTSTGKKAVFNNASTPQFVFFESGSALVVTAATTVATAKIFCADVLLVSVRSDCWIRNNVASAFKSNAVC